MRMEIYFKTSGVYIYKYCNVDYQRVAKQRLDKQTSTTEKVSMRSAPSKSSQI
jgi:hypothetical protein